MQGHAKLIGDSINSTRAPSRCVPPFRETPMKSVNPVDRIDHYFRRRVMTALECHELKCVMDLRARLPEKIRYRSTQQRCRIVGRHPATVDLLLESGPTGTAAPSTRNLSPSRIGKSKADSCDVSITTEICVEC